MSSGRRLLKKEGFSRFIEELFLSVKHSLGFDEVVGDRMGIFDCETKGHLKVDKGYRFQLKVRRTF